MEFVYIFTVCCALAVLFVVFVSARKHSSVAGTKAFLWQIVFVSIWAVGSLLELLSATEKGMLFWRNIEQIGIFLLPVTCVYFAVEYARYVRLKKYLLFFWIIPLAALVLIFMDSVTHIMRLDYIVSYNPFFGKALSVHVTPVGMLFVSYNYLLVIVSLIILFVFSRHVERSMRRQVTFVLCATGLVFLFALLKTAFLEGTSVNIPIVVMYLPGSLILYYNLYRNSFFNVTPLALDKVFDVIEEGIIVTDGSGVIVDRNPFASELMRSFCGIREYFVGKKLNEVLNDYPDWVDFIQNNMPGELEIEKGNENPHYIHIRVYPLRSHKEKPIGSISIIRDITALRLQELSLKMKAETDCLTGLLNREGFMNTFSKIIEEYAITGGAVSVLLMDLDKFKWINDTFGHDNGDKAIQAFADLLKEVLRRNDAVGRFGGDEFVAVLPGVDKQEATEIASRVLKSVKESAVHLADGTNVHISLSIGICDNEIVKQAEDMLKCADQAMYIAKNSKNNCCVAWVI